MLHELYRTLRNKMPNKYKGFLTKAVFMLPNKPFVKKDKINKKHKFPSNFRGGMIISADFELAWAFRYSKSNTDPRVKADQSRKNFPFLLKLFENYQIPITWATVGHLFLESCNKQDKVPH